jgi:hypothetical protein
MPSFSAKAVNLSLSAAWKSKASCNTTSPLSSDFFIFPSIISILFLIAL